MQWSLFGQLVILAMIQLGGLGFMTVITLVSFALHRRIGLSERLIMVSTLNLNDLDGVVRMVRHALMGTFLIEGIGAVILAACMIPEFGLLGGIWRGIFHAVSAFCNAGFDLLGGRFGAYSSLAGYNNNPVVLLTIGGLIVVGGLGFFVWEDILTKRSIHRLSVYSKMVLLMTVLLILGGAAFFLVEEYSNPAILGDMTLGQKIYNALFQSITLRTAGFDAVGRWPDAIPAMHFCHPDADWRLLRLHRRRFEDGYRGGAAVGPPLRPGRTGAGHLPGPHHSLPSGAQCYDPGAGDAVFVPGGLYGDLHGGRSALSGLCL